jgi:hypothetical protein
MLIVWNAPGRDGPPPSHGAIRMSDSLAVRLDGAPRMDTRSFVPPATRVEILGLIPLEDWQEYANCQFLAVAVETARIVAGGDDEESVIEKAEVDPSVGTFFVTRARKRSGSRGNAG